MSSIPAPTPTVVTPRQLLDSRLRAAIEAVTGTAADPLLAASNNPQFADYQSNAAMSLAKTVAEASGTKTNPRQLADKILAALDLAGIAESVTVAGPGFINIKLSQAYLATALKDFTGPQGQPTAPPAAHPLTVVVDLSGPNVAKEMHVGHLRSTIIGDAVANVLNALGHHVVRQNHLGDWGTQFGMLIAYLKTLGNEGSGAIADLEEFYRQAKARFDADPAFAEEARKTVVRLQAGGVEELRLWKLIGDETRLAYEAVYKRLRVNLKREDERGESTFNPMLAGIVADLKALGLAKQSEGATVVFVPGTENPLMVEKTGGGYLYGTTDLAAVRYRVDVLKAQRALYFVDARQGQHFALVFAVARLAGWDKGCSFEHAAFGTMLGADNKPFKTRTGGVVKLRDLLEEAVERANAFFTDRAASIGGGGTVDELSATDKARIAEAVGIGAVKYADLSKDRTSDYVFTWDKMLSLDGNTAPYLQYAFARTQSILRKAADAGVAIAPAPSPKEPAELALAKHLLRYGEVLEDVGRELKPHHLCAYLYDLAGRFSTFYEQCDVMKAEGETRAQRLALVAVTGKTLAAGLALLGIDCPEKM